MPRFARNLAGLLRLKLRTRLPGPLKVNIGAGDKVISGWLGMDKDRLDMTLRADWARWFRPHSIDRILAEHVLEHLEPPQVQAFLRCARDFLSESGRLRIAVPDGRHPDPGYLEQVRPGGSGAGADDHRQLFDWRTLSAQLEAGGYRVELLEWFDDAGQFNRRPWSAEDGPVLRSARNDPRNAVRELAYTSLIVDALPA